MDVKAWLQTAGEPAAETCFPPGEAPALPYVIFLDSVTRSGSDLRNLLRFHSLTVERYSTGTEDNPALEKLFDDRGIQYTKDKQWSEYMECYLTTYDFETALIEKEGEYNA